MLEGNFANSAAHVVLVRTSEILDGSVRLRVRRALRGRTQVRARKSLDFSRYASLISSRRPALRRLQV